MKEKHFLLTFKISGMNSPHAAMLVEQAAKKVSGIKRIKGDYHNQRAEIFGTARVEDVKRALLEAGYESREEAKEEIEDPEQFERNQRLQNYRGKVFIGILLSVVLVLGSYPEWLPVSLQVFGSRYLLFVLTLPVPFWVGLEIYRESFVSLKNRKINGGAAIALGTMLMFLYSAAVTFFPEWFTGTPWGHDTYFHVVAVALTAVVLVKFFYLCLQKKNSEVIKKRTSTHPKTARVIRKGKEFDIFAEDVRADDILLSNNQHSKE